MPTNFHVSSRPALRCVAGEAYPISAVDRAGGFFTRLRVAERLVIHSGPQQSLAPATGAWVGSCAPLELAAEFGKKIFHA